MIEVYHVQPIHADDPRIWVLPEMKSIIDHWIADAYKKVADVMVDDLEEAWRSTNSIDQPWYHREDVFTYPPNRFRSSMVGDVFIKDGAAFYVDMIGFEPVPLPNMELCAPVRLVVNGKAKVFETFKKIEGTIKGKLTYEQRRMLDVAAIKGNELHASINPYDAEMITAEDRAEGTQPTILLFKTAEELASTFYQLTEEI